MSATGAAAEGGSGRGGGSDERNNGVFISLEEMERKEAEKLVAAQAEEARLQEEDEKRQRDARASEMYWAYNLYVLTSGPAILALMTLFAAPFVIHGLETCPTSSLNVFVVLTMLIAYFYLFVYAWMLLGPLPFHTRMHPLKVIFGVIATISVAVYGLLAVWCFTNRECADSAPGEYTYCMFQVVIFAFGSTSAASKFIKEKLQARALRERKERRKRLKEQLAKEMEAAALMSEEEDEDNDEGDDGGEDGDVEDDDEEEEEEEEDDDDDDVDDDDGGTEEHGEVTQTNEVRENEKTTEKDFSTAAASKDGTDKKLAQASK